MQTQIKTNLLFFLFTVCLCISSFLLTNAAAQDAAEPAATLR